MVFSGRTGKAKCRACVMAVLTAAMMLCGTLFAPHGSALAVQRAAVAVTTVRMGGTDRFETAVRIAEKGWNSAETVFIASAYSYADALAGAPLAYAYDAPILLTAPGTLSRATRDALEDLGAKKVFILGGRAAVSGSVEDTLKYSGYRVERIYGDTRYTTAIAIARALRDKTGASGEVFIASGANYPDALSASPAAAVKGSPILYSPANGKLDSSTLAYIESCRFDTAYILGGNAAIASAADGRLSGAGVDIRERLGGGDRYETSLLIAKRFSSELRGSDAAFATGKNFPDALAGSVFAAKKCVPVLLTDNVNAREDVKSFVADRGAQIFYAFGSSDVVSDNVLKGYMSSVREITSSLTSADREALTRATALIAGHSFDENTDTNDLLSYYLLRPSWAKEAGISDDTYPAAYDIYDCSHKPDPLGYFNSSESYAVMGSAPVDELLMKYFSRTAEHGKKYGGVYYQDSCYYVLHNDDDYVYLPTVEIKRVFDLGGGRVYVAYAYNSANAFCTLKSLPSSSLGWSYIKNSEKGYVDISDFPESGDISEAVYLGVYDYNGSTAVRKNMPTLKYRFRVDGEEKLYTMSNGKVRSDGVYEYPIQNTLKVGYRYSLKVTSGKVTEAKEIVENIQYTPPVKGTPGRRTLGNFLRIAMEPVGTTLYIYGGGWDWDGTASSVQSRTIGVSPDWVRFFRSQNAGFTFRDKDGKSENKNAKTSYYPYGGINQYYYAGLDCSGYVAWAFYNTLISQSGGSGYVMGATKMSRQFAARGLGDYTGTVPRPDGTPATACRPGDVFSISGHIWVSLGTCADSSVVILHSTPSYSRSGQPGGGVQIGAIGTSENCEAFRLANRYMSAYYPEWYKRYPVSLKSPGLYLNFSGSDPGRFRWKSGVLSDPEGFSDKNAAQTLAALFGE